MFLLCPRMVLLPLLLLLAFDARAQNLEPRRWTHLPVKSNFVGVGTGSNQGDIYLDHSLGIEDGSVDSYFLSASYIHSFELFGKTARMDVVVPYVNGRWEGVRFGMPVSTRRSGFSDPTLRFSLNLLGSPALQGKEFAAYRMANPVRTIVGVALELTLPVGEYYNDRLINLGNNRYVLRPQLGLLHQHNSWEFETTASVFFYGENREMFGGVTREQDPLWFVQVHANYNFPSGKWLGVGAGYGYGGENTIGQVKKDDDGRVSFWGGSFGFPLSPRQSIKLTYAQSETNTRTGSDLDSFIASWSMML